METMEESKNMGTELRQANNELAIDIFVLTYLKI